MKIKDILTTALLCSIICSGGMAKAAPSDDTFTVDLPCAGPSYDVCQTDPIEKIEIPNGRPIYALLVSGFHQNKNLDMFHFYNFAKCLQEKGAYVHYAWWNNLLAPYMERPLHNPNSAPSTGGIPLHDSLLFLYEPWPLCLTIGGCVPDKAVPAEDYQFQADATELLITIRQHNPDAIIILVGHSMGGDAIVRLADSMPPDFDIDLLAPIDPVGNRTCVPNYEGWVVSTWTSTCNGLLNFTRFQATHEDWFYFPPPREFGSNIKYLYHRWQQEFGPPYDYSCPGGGNELNWPCLSLLPAEDYLFGHPATPVTSIHHGSTNVQDMVDTELFSGKDVPVVGSNFAGGLDGHGEIVGFRGALLGDAFYDFDDWLVYILGDLTRVFGFESYPLALEAQGNWPSRDNEVLENPVDLVRLDRVQYLKEWEKDPNYLYKNGYEPWNPGLCMVSRDLCNILDTIVGPPDTAVNLPPVADAGPDQNVECSGPNGTEVTLAGSGSTDPDDDPLTFTWAWPDGIMTGETIDLSLPVGSHSITLTVDDGEGNTDIDTVDVTVMDSAEPSVSVSLSPDVLWPPNHKMVAITASIQVSDSCDDSPLVELVSIISNEAENGIGDGNTNDDIQGASYGTDDRAFSLRAERAGNGLGRVYTIIYGAIDASGNVADATAEITVQ